MKITHTTKFIFQDLADIARERTLTARRLRRLRSKSCEVLNPRSVMQLFRKAYTGLERATDGLNYMFLIITRSDADRKQYDRLKAL